MPNLIDNYCDSIYESSIEILNFFEAGCKYVYDDSKNKAFKLNDDKKKYILVEAIIYCFMLHETITFNKIVNIRNEILNRLCGQDTSILVDYIFGKNKISTSEINELINKRYDEYANVYMKKKECNLIYMPIGFPSEMYEDGFTCLMLRFHGIIIETLDGNRHIPGIEPGPLVIRDFMFDIQYHSLFDAFYKTVLDNILKRIKEKF